MAYRRVIPRDLFNEGSLLNLMGLLTLKLEDLRRGHTASLDHIDDGPFVIEQDPSDGSISLANVRLHIAGRSVHLYRPLNSRSPNPLWVVPNGDEAGLFDATLVFDVDGVLSADFRALIQPGALPAVGEDEDDGGYPGPCSDPGGHEFPPVEEHERSLCVHCGADGDA